MPLLTSEQFRATFGESPHRVGSDEPPPFEFWPYFESIPATDFQGYDCSVCRVENAWKMNPGHYEHVLINSEDRNVFMVMVLDLKASSVYGHILLDLNREYGLDA